MRLTIRPALPALLFLLPGAAARAQSAPTTGAADETVVLSRFVVSSESTGRYQATDATSGTRVRVALMDSPQSVSVVTRDLIEDIGAGRVLDAARFVAGVYESTIPNAQDRTTIRGFQNDGATVDGFSYFTFANLDPVIIDRIEVVKGPNAIMAPQGVPGGTVNNVTKKPLFSDRGYVSGQVGRYGSNRAELDVNRVVINGRLAFRLVGAGQDSDDYGRDNHHSSGIAMPMVTYRFKPGTELTVQAQFSNWWATNYLGLPISVYSGTDDRAELPSGVPRDFSAAGDNIPRHQKAQHYRAFFTADLTDRLSMRIAANFINSSARSYQVNLSAPSAALSPVKLDPATGLWKWDGATRLDDPLYAIGGSINWQYRTYANWQNDFVYEFQGRNFRSSTVAGYAINYSDTRDEYVVNFTLPSPISLHNYVDRPYTITNTSSWNTRVFRDQQVYAYEVLSFLDERLLLSGGLSRNWYQIRNYDKVRQLNANNAPNVWLPSAGIVTKVAKGVSLFAGFSRQSTAIAPSTTSQIAFKTQTSRQYEFGARVQLAENKLYATLSRFDIKQNNFSVPNPLNNAVPPPVPPLPPLYMDRIAHGVELELTYAVTKNFSLVGNATKMKNRDPNGIPFRGNAERSGALWMNYAFDEGALKGLSLGVGIDYLSRRAGDSASGLTSASTPEHPIPIQPSFWLPARTLVNASVSYRWGSHWRVQVNVDNLLDEDYLAASLSRTMVYPGTPFNARLTVAYHF